ncbi:MAG: hypothetical protein GX594_19440 [Pirellulaceae bacterium]|nr:hypothetical protein [Pirellulaceae bacterium]
MRTNPNTDFQTLTLHWTIVTLDAWGTALIRRDQRLDHWATLYNLPVKVYGAEYDPAFWWECEKLGQISPAERQAFSRAAKALEAAGLLVLIRRGGTRLSHIQPTPKGLRVALELTPAVNRPSIQKAIETAVWATTEHLAAVGGKSRRPRARKVKK